MDKQNQIDTWLEEYSSETDLSIDTTTFESTLFFGTCCENVNEESVCYDDFIQPYSINSIDITEFIFY